MFFTSGFRPFFLCASAYGLIAMALWLFVYTSGSLLLPDVPPHYVHAHEMLFGFVAAAIAGFMLTAVPSWTGEPGIRGGRLQLLALLWLAGRVGMLFAPSLPVYLVAALPLLFIPALAMLLAPALLRAANRNRALLVVLMLFWLCELRVVVGMVLGDSVPIGQGLRGGLNIVLLLITVIGGRIVPTFTSNALRAASVLQAVRSYALLDRLVIAAMVVFALGDIVAPLHGATAGAAGVAGMLQLIRLAGWQGLRTLSQPIVLVLHVAYLWLPTGLILYALYVLGDVGWAAHWRHALAAGAAGTMIVAVMTRASLGHTGRPLKVHLLTTLAYIALTLSVVVRVFGPSFLHGSYQSTVLAAGGLWALSFALIVVIYVPVLLRGRVDGKPG